MTTTHTALAFLGFPLGFGLQHGSLAHPHPSARCASLSPEKPDRVCHCLFVLVRALRACLDVATESPDDPDLLRRTLEAADTLLADASVAQAVLDMELFWHQSSLLGTNLASKLDALRRRGAGKEPKIRLALRCPPPSPAQPGPSPLASAGDAFRDESGLVSGYDSEETLACELLPPSAAGSSDCASDDDTVSLECYDSDATIPYDTLYQPMRRLPSRRAGDGWAGRGRDLRQMLS